MSDFDTFNLSPPILEALGRIGFQKATPIQAATLALIQEHKDLIALAETGSGKTAACAIPICDRVDVTRRDIQALIIVPTRELALQYATEVQKIGLEKGVKAFAIFGGESADLQQAKLKHGVQVLVATPGRLIDFIYSRQIALTEVETLILDEADEMLSMGFYDDLEFIIRCLVHEHQTLLFSATMPKEVKRLAIQHMQEPKEISLIEKRSTPKKIIHRFLYCNPHERCHKLAQLMQEAEIKQTLIFCHSRNQCEEVFRYLKKQVPRVDYLHGGLSQELRTKITDRFRNGRTQYMVATDIAARGLDFSNVTHVFIFELSRDPDIYIHRSGRTGRSGRSGVVTTLVTKREMGTAKKIIEAIPQEPIWLEKSSSEKKSAPRHRRGAREKPKKRPS